MAHRNVESIPESSAAAPSLRIHPTRVYKRSSKKILLSTSQSCHNVAFRGNNTKRRQHGRRQVTSYNERFTLASLRLIWGTSIAP